MAYSSIIGVSSVYQYPSLQTIPRKCPPSLTLPLSEKAHFNALKSRNLKGISSATATSNSVFSEEAFKVLTGEFSKGSFGEELDAEEEGEFESEGEGLGEAEGEGAGEDELHVAKLGLPEKLVESLTKRGITQLFPIQVYVPFIVFTTTIFGLYPVLLMWLVGF